MSSNEGFSVVAPIRTMVPASTCGRKASCCPHPMPISLMLWAAPGHEPTLIKVASAYEAATHHRVPPPDFGPVKKTGRYTSSMPEAGKELQ
jgi:hypothetical protein